jgi:hypothetical protein
LTTYSFLIYMICTNRKVKTVLFLFAELVEQFQVHNLCKLRKSTKNPLSNFGLIEQIMALSSILLALFCMTSTLFCRWICLNRKSTVLSKLHEDYQTFFSRKLPVKGHSQTTMIRFTLFLTTYHPLCWHFLWYINVDKKLTFLDHLPTSSCKHSLWTPP